ncbi:hypothetical protein TNCV_4176901 [Trichonephila clavipes]|nr:hypothetical protein TNCV_4176901 [Trichonephila clavipes]
MYIASRFPVRPRKCSGQGIGSWVACNEFKSSTTKDPQCRGAMCVKSVESSNVLPLNSLIKLLTYFLNKVALTTRAVGSLVVRASDSRPEGLGSMLDVTKYSPSAHGVRAR